MSFLMQKYKVFLNDKWVFFGNPEQIQLYEDQHYDILEASNQLICDLAEMIKTDCFDKNIVLIHKTNIEEFFRFFLKQFLVLEAAGGIVQHTDNTFLMIKRLGVWDFPKGKLESGENNKNAALREVQEETGVDRLRISKELPNTYHIYRYKHKWILKLTYWYLMESDFTGALTPQLEEDILEAKWIPQAEMNLYLEKSYESLKELIKEAKIM